jgi:hypothetical protein
MPAKKTAKQSTDGLAAKAAAAKKTAKKAVKKSAVKKSAMNESGLPVKPPSEPAALKVTPDMIARAAYLNYRRRVEQGLPGDHESDWLEAERQLAG